MKNQMKNRSNRKIPIRSQKREAFRCVRATAPPLAASSPQAAASEAASSSSDEDDSVRRVPDGKAGALVLAYAAADDEENNLSRLPANKKVKPVLDLGAGDAFLGADMSDEDNARKNVAAVAASEERHKKSSDTLPCPYLFPTCPTYAIHSPGKKQPKRQHQEIQHQLIFHQLQKWNIMRVVTCC